MGFKDTLFGPNESDGQFLSLENFCRLCVRCMEPHTNAPPAAVKYPPSLEMVTGNPFEIGWTKMESSRLTHDPDGVGVPTVNESKPSSAPVLP